MALWAGFQGYVTPLAHLMVCYAKASKKLSWKTVRKKVGTFKTYLAGDWKTTVLQYNHLILPNRLPKTTRKYFQLNLLIAKSKVSDRNTVH